MKVIKSITTTDDILTFSNIDEDDYPTWVSGKPYVMSDRVVYNHKIYEAIVGVTSTTPPDLDQEKWLFFCKQQRKQVYGTIYPADAEEVYKAGWDRAKYYSSYVSSFICDIFNRGGRRCKLCSADFGP